MQTPPPLPPRTRTNTHSEFQRSFTNPESETFKKRACINIFDFLRYKRAGSCTTETSPPQYETINTLPTVQPAASIRRIHCVKVDNCIGNKRNSFSSPDLTKFNYLDNYDEFADDLSERSSSGFIETSNLVIDLAVIFVTF